MTTLILKVNGQIKEVSNKRYYKAFQMMKELLIENGYRIEQAQEIIKLLNRHNKIIYVCDNVKASVVMNKTYRRNESVRCIDKNIKRDSQIREIKKLIDFCCELMNDIKSGKADNPIDGINSRKTKVSNVRSNLLYMINEAETFPEYKMQSIRNVVYNL